MTIHIGPYRAISHGEVGQRRFMIHGYHQIRIESTGDSNLIDTDDLFSSSPADQYLRSVSVFPLQSRGQLPRCRMYIRRNGSMVKLVEMTWVHWLKALMNTCVFRCLQAELLLHHSGDFLVRESVKVPGQFILSGRYKDQFKHLLLIDPEGIVSGHEEKTTTRRRLSFLSQIRTKDYEFDSIQHLISYHRSGNIPIVSADSELLLQTPVLRTK